MKKFLLIIIILILCTKLFSQNFEILDFGTDSSLEIMSWNIENFPKNGEPTIEYVSEVIKNLDVDVIAIQEISDSEPFYQLLNLLDDYDGTIESQWFAGLGFIYKANTVEINQVYEIYTESEYWNPFPRSPLVLDFYFKNENYIVINNHLKCCGDGILEINDNDDEEYRRQVACNLLKEYIDENLDNKNVIVVGDLNDELTDIYENNVFNCFIDDADNYLFADMGIALSNSENWSFPNWPSHLDHILITNELFDEFENIDTEIETLKIEECFDGNYWNYDENISDHRPVGIKFNPNFSSKIMQKQFSEQIKCYPNPFTEDIIFDLKTFNSPLILEIYNSQNQIIEIIKINPQTNKHIWKPKNISSGIYFLKISDSKTFIETKKVIYIE